jgi:hypothetical protein
MVNLANIEFKPITVLTGTDVKLLLEYALLAPWSMTHNSFLVFCMLMDHRLRSHLITNLAAAYIIAVESGMKKFKEK